MRVLSLNYGSNIVQESEPEPNAVLCYNQFIMDVYIPILIAGFGGGVVRGIVGFLKYQFQFKNTKFSPLYFIGMMFLSGVVGVLTAIAVREAGIPVLGGAVTPGIAFIVGYAGGDFIENVYKIFIGKPVIY